MIRESEPDESEELRAETLSVAPGRARLPRAAAEPELCLTLLCHPDLRRVGERSRLGGLRAGQGVELSRAEPLFAREGVGEAQPIADPYVSRSCARLELRRGGDAMLAARRERGIVVDGRGVEPDGPAPLSVAALNAGVVVELQGRIGLLLHRVGAVDPVGEPYGLVGASGAMAAVRQEIARVASRDVSVLIRGESGTGKELVARAIHRASARAEGPMVSVNMAGITPTTAASELFGHARGAFTGAVRTHDGYFGLADGGTLFLDEIGDTPLDVQALLFRVLETGEVQPVGGSRTRSVDVRVLTATHTSLEHAIAAGRFRGPLFHRLASYQIDLPPLRERREDIPLLLLYFLEQELAAAGELDVLDRPDPRDPPWLDLSLMLRLFRHPWPGNVRELRNAVRQLVVGSQGLRVARVSAALDRLLRDPGAVDAPGDAPTGRGASSPREADDDNPVDTLLRAARHRKQEPETFVAALGALIEQRQGNISRVAEDSGFSRTQIYRWIEQYGLRRG